MPLPGHNFPISVSLSPPFSCGLLSSSWSISYRLGVFSSCKLFQLHSNLFNVLWTLVKYFTVFFICVLYKKRCRYTYYNLVYISLYLVHCTFYFIRTFSFPFYLKEKVQYCIAIVHEYLYCIVKWDNSVGVFGTFSTAILDSSAL